MAIAIRNSAPLTTAGTTSSLSVTASGLTQSQAGDVLIIIQGNDYFTLSTFPTPTVAGSTSGVTSIGSADHGTNSAHCKAWYYVVGSTGNLTINSGTFTGAADEEKCLIVYVLSGVDNGAVIDGTAGTGAAGPTTSWSVSATTTLSPDSFLIGHANDGGGGYSGTFTPPSGMTEAYDGNLAGLMGYTGAYLQLSASGSTGAKVFTATGPGDYAGLLFAVKTNSGGAATSPEMRSRFPSWLAPWVAPRGRPYQLFGSAVTDQWPALGDTVSAADSLTVAAVFAVDDATSAATDSLSVAAAVPLDDPTNTTTDELSVVRPNDPYQMLPVQDWALLNPGIGPHAQILQLLGDSSGASSFQLTEAGVADDVAVVTPAIPLTETASVTDALVAAAIAPLTETAVGDDSLAVTAAFTVADTAVGDDSLAVDTGSGPADTFQAPQWLPGMFVSPRLASPQGMGDTATGLIALAETVSGADAAAVAPAVPLTETAGVIDSAAVAATGSLTGDVATAVDAAVLAVAGPLTELVSAADVLDVSILGEVEQNQVLPQMPVDPPPLQLLGETAISSASVNLTDTAAAADSLAISVTLTVADVAAAADVMSASIAQPSLTELVSAADALAITVLMSMAETASGSDSLSIGGSGIQGNVYPNPASGAGGNVYPRSSRVVTGAIG